VAAPPIQCPAGLVPSHHNTTCGPAVAPVTAAPVNGACPNFALPCLGTHGTVCGPVNATTGTCM
jgi:hypothetical protein